MSTVRQITARLAAPPGGGTIADHGAGPAHLPNRHVPGDQLDSPDPDRLGIDANDLLGLAGDHLRALHQRVLHALEKIETQQ